MKTCDYHNSEAVEGEVVRETGKAIFVNLVCVECGKSRGERRKAKEGR